MSGATEHAHICTPDDPWTEAKGRRSIHPSATSVGDCADGCCANYLCPICQKRFRVELPQ